ncbi:MAG: bifunctional hydroxymethylpyrimidine kinase/phosphomethylpyrimidine kinase [Candidatus Eremiobacter antarcticus]|nr:hydroxymethylpyrimidine/phosphomethylpyrimidine kinase [Candidatus Eremiobacteraeota bacterium]MBC5808189.1 hydroxymethylpyrimidine/phosphomethylpyrimidine kinase [Candidatus Eremiobacteraeota bacterium]
MSASFPSVCSIGTVDPTGAAGLATDLRVFALLEVVGNAAVAGLSAQNAAGVRRVLAVPPSVIRAQLESVWQEARPQAICIGLLPRSAAIKCVRKFLKAQAHLPAVVLDPVIASSSGFTFLRREDVANLKELLSLATVVTPNIGELSRLTAMPINNLTEVEAAARALAKTGCSVLATGGHLPGRFCVDVLAHESRVTRYRSMRLPGTMRGMGGILAAALAAHLARGEKFEHAVVKARAFVRGAHAGAAMTSSGTSQLFQVRKRR